MDLSGLGCCTGSLSSTVLPVRHRECTSTWEQLRRRLESQESEIDELRRDLEQEKAQLRSQLIHAAELCAFVLTATTELLQERRSGPPGVDLDEQINFCEDLQRLFEEENDRLQSESERHRSAAADAIPRLETLAAEHSSLKARLEQLAHEDFIIEIERLNRELEHIDRELEIAEVDEQSRTLPGLRRRGFLPHDGEERHDYQSGTVTIIRRPKAVPSGSVPRSDSAIPHTRTQEFQLEPPKVNRPRAFQAPPRRSRWAPREGDEARVGPKIRSRKPSKAAREREKERLRERERELAWELKHATGEADLTGTIEELMRGGCLL